MTFEGEVSWTATAKVRVKAENMSEAKRKLLANHDAYLHAPAYSCEPALTKHGVTFNLKQVQ